MTPEQITKFWETAQHYPYMVYLPDSDQWMGHTDILVAVEHAMLEEAWARPERVEHEHS